MMHFMSFVLRFPVLVFLESPLILVGMLIALLRPGTSLWIALVMIISTLREATGARASRSRLALRIKGDVGGYISICRQRGRRERREQIRQLLNPEY